MALKIVGSGTKDQIEEKRFVVPGAILLSPCPECKTETEMLYLSYPMVNTPISLPFYCEVCQVHWEERAVIRLTVEAVPTG